MVAKKREITSGYKIKKVLLGEFTTGRRSERIRELLKPQELTSIHVLLVAALKDWELLQL